MTNTKKFYALISIEIIAENKDVALQVAKDNARQLDSKYDNRAHVYEIGHYEGLKEVTDYNTTEIQLIN